ncbi:unnamed protein product, partial [Symbiodinium sp. CCMP2456]
NRLLKKESVAARMPRATVWTHPEGVVLDHVFKELRRLSALDGAGETGARIRHARHDWNDLLMVIGPLFFG